MMEAHAYIEVFQLSSFDKYAKRILYTYRHLMSCFFSVVHTQTFSAVNILLLEIQTTFEPKI